MKKYLFIILSIFAFSSFQSVYGATPDSQGFYYYSGTVRDAPLKRTVNGKVEEIPIGTQVLFRSKSATVADHGSYAINQKEIWRNGQWQSWYGGYIKGVGEADKPVEGEDKGNGFDFSGLFGFFTNLFNKLMDTLNNLLKPLWDFLGKLFEIKDFKMPSFKPFLNIRLNVNMDGFRVFGHTINFSIIDEWGRIAWLSMAVPSLINMAYRLAKGEE